MYTYAKKGKKKYTTTRGGKKVLNVTSLVLVPKQKYFRNNRRIFRNQRRFIFYEDFGLFLMTNRTAKAVLHFIKCGILFFFSCKLRELVHLKLLPFIKDKYNVKEDYIIALHHIFDLFFSNLTTLLFMDALAYFEVSRYLNDEFLVPEFTPKVPFNTFVRDFEPPALRRGWFSRRIFENPKKMEEFFNFKISTPVQLYLQDLFGKEEFALLQSAKTIGQAGELIRNKSSYYEKINKLLRNVSALIPSFPELEQDIRNFNNLKFVSIKDSLDQEAQNDLIFQLYWKKHHNNLMNSLANSEQKLSEMKKYGPEVLAMLWQTKHSLELILFSGAMNELQKNPKQLQEVKEYVLNKTQEIAAQFLKEKIK